LNRVREYKGFDIYQDEINFTFAAYNKDRKYEDPRTAEAVAKADSLKGLLKKIDSLSGVVGKVVIVSHSNGYRKPERLVEGKITTVRPSHQGDYRVQMAGADWGMFSAGRLLKDTPANRKVMDEYNQMADQMEALDKKRDRLLDKAEYHEPEDFKEEKQE
jgi:hypothetical protein